jgi:integrase
MRRLKRRGDGEGSVFQLRSKWRAQLPYYNDAGARRFSTRSFDTKGEADEWLTGERHLRFQGVSIAPGKRTVGVLLDEWLELCATKLRPKTERNYKDLVDTHLKPGLGHVLLQKLTTPQVQRFLNGKAEKLSPKTVKHLRDTLRAAINVAITWQLVRSNAAAKAKPPNEGEKRLRVLSIDEAKVFVNALQSHRDGVLFRLMLSVGLRKGEALGLRDEDLELPLIHIRRGLQTIGRKLILGPPKSKAGVRSLPLSPEMSREMKRYLSERERRKQNAGELWIDTGFVFVTDHGAPILPRHLNTILTDILTEAGIAHLRVHDLRHSTATFAIADKMPANYVKEMLGHSDIRTTLQTYTKLVPAVLGETTSTLERILVTDKVTDKREKATSPNPYGYWSGRRDLNSGPPGPEPGALPG